MMLDTGLFLTDMGVAAGQTLLCLSGLLPCIDVVRVPNYETCPFAVEMPDHKNLPACGPNTGKGWAGVNIVSEAISKASVTAIAKALAVAVANSKGCGVLVSSCATSGESKACCDISLDSTASSFSEDAMAKAGALLLMRLFKLTLILVVRLFCPCATHDTSNLVQLPPSDQGLLVVSCIGW